MTREELVERAHELHVGGCNCAQAVACAFIDYLDIDEATLFAATEGLGFGMGNMQGTCGAISGACVVAGLLTSTRNLEHPDSKKITYGVCKQLLERYEEAIGSVQCATIKGKTGGPLLMPCQGCVTTAAGVAYDVLVAEAGR
jgi:C_GCAxxG_C_C family probable redox protein